MKRISKTEYDVVVAGAGLGGLTAASLLSKEGFSTLVIERLPRLGGRFANIPFRGFQLTTGALHLIPHRRGAVRRLVNDELKCDIEFIDTSPVALPIGVSIAKHIRELPARFDSVFRFSLGLGVRETPVVETMMFMAKIIAGDKPCMPKGGCGSIVQALEKTILDNRREIVKQTSLSGIEVRNGKATGVAIERGNSVTSFVRASLLISDVGPAKTLDAMQPGPTKESFRRRLGEIKPVEGIRISIESDRSVLDELAGRDVGLVFTPSCERVAGIVEPSSLDPGLAPPGKTLLMTYQPILSPNIEEEIKAGLKDLGRILPDFKKNCRVLTAQAFRGEWPVNRARQGRDASQTTPIEGLYLVGDGAKPSGFIMAEGAVESARRVVKRIIRSRP